MRANQLVLVQGMRDTRATLAEWNREPWPVLRGWLGWSTLVALGLLVAVYIVARLTPADPTPLLLPGINEPATMLNVGQVVFRNSLVLALHALACVAGFIAGSSLPQSAANYNGLWRRVHDLAGPLAIGFVICATAFSLFTQAHILGGQASTIANQLSIDPALLLLSLTPHAIPELVALFLPLAAWMIASRLGDWHELLAATFVTVALAFPVVVVSAFVEVYVSPRLLVALLG